MKGPLRIYYDEEADFLEVAAGAPTECYAEEVELGVFVRYDKKTRQAKSIGILNFKKRSKSIQDIIVNLPFEVSFSDLK